MENLVERSSEKNLYGFKVMVPVPQTDTGGLVLEYQGQRVKPC